MSMGTSDSTAVESVGSLTSIPPFDPTNKAEAHACSLVPPQEMAVPATRGSRHEDLSGGKGPEIRFRPARYKLKDVGEFRWEVLVRESDGVVQQCSLVDISANGIAVVLPEDLVLRVNETIPSVQVRYDDNVAYAGRACVVSIREVDGAAVAGLYLMDGLLEVSRLLDLKAVKSASACFLEDIGRRQSAWSVGGYPEVKAALSDFRLFLEDAYFSLTEAEKKLPWQVADGQVDEALRAIIARSFAEGPARTFCSYFSTIDRLAREVEPKDREFVKALSRRHLHHLILQGPLFSRSLAKPRGYAGDYVVMNYIYGQSLEGRSLFGKFVHFAGCQHDVCAAVRNRIALFYRIVCEHLGRRDQGRPYRIASIGSGPAEEFLRTLETLGRETAPFDILLFDADDESLNFSYTRLTETIHRRNLQSLVKLTLLYDSIGHLIFDDSVFRGSGPFDLILCAGLYDYLTLKKAQALTAKLYSQLAPGGTLIIGNMAPNNPSRWAMEDLAEWYLIYRTAEDLFDLCAQLPKDAAVRVFHEPLGINLFLEVRSGGNGGSVHG